jgi:hypothetical protein
MIGRRKKFRPDVVVSVETQSRQASELAAIVGQARLADPRSNPAVRQHADALRDQQHRRVLDAEHARLIRRYRVADQRAAFAEKTLEAIQTAQATMSPARSVIDLHNGRKKFLGVAMAASLTLSAGSAMGVAHLAAQLGAPEAAGYIAEIGLTGLSTASILYRSHIAQHDGKVEGWQSKVLWVLMVVPLLASITANALSNGFVGVCCSIGAAAFSLLSAVISDRSAATLRAKAAEVTIDDLADLQAIAMGDGLGEDLLPVQAADASETAHAADGGETEEGTGPALSVEESPALSDWVQGVVDRGAAELEAWLADGLSARDDDPADDAAGPVPPAPAPSGRRAVVSALPVSSPEPVPMLPPGSIDADQVEESDSAARVLPATQARLAIGASTRQRVADYQAANPKATVPEIAKALQVSERTVRAARSVLKGGGQS